MSAEPYDGNDPSAQDVERAHAKTMALAKRLFEAYNATSPNPNKSHDGKDVPPFEACGEQVQAKWVGAAGEAERMAHDLGRKVYDAAVSGMARALNADSSHEPTPEWAAMADRLKAIIAAGMAEAKSLLEVA